MQSVTFKSQDEAVALSPEPLGLLHTSRIAWSKGIVALTFLALADPCIACLPRRDVACVAAGPAVQRVCEEAVGSWTCRGLQLPS